MKKILLLFTLLLSLSISAQSTPKKTAVDSTEQKVIKTVTTSQTRVTQCKGTAKSTGVQCKNKTKNENGYCYIHKSQAPDYVKPQKTNYVGRCNATTQKGTQCKRNASSGTRYCWQHQ